MKHLVDNNFNTNKLVNVPTPTSAGDAVNKEYADTKDASNYLTPEMFGAVGDDSNDDAPAFRAMFAQVKVTQQAVRLTSGKTYAFKSPDPNDPTNAIAVFLDNMKDVTVIGWGARIKGYDGIHGTSTSAGAIIWLDTASSDYVNTWVGVTVDSTQITRPSGGNQSIGGLSFRGPWNHNIDSCNFDHGIISADANGIVLGNGDQSLFLSGYANAIVTNCKFRGAPDLGIYVSGSSAKNLKIVGNHFYRCARGVGIKRLAGFWLVQSNSFEECGIGVYTPTADGLSNNGGKYGIVSGNRFKKIQARAIDIDGLGSGTIVSNNYIEDFYRYISDGSEYNLGEVVAAIRVRAPHSNVFGNYITFTDWTPNTASGIQAVGIILAYNANYTNAADWSEVHDNIMLNVPVGIIVGNGVTAVREYNNHIRSATTQLTDSGTNTRGLMSRGTFGATTGNASNMHIISSGDIFRSTSAKKYKKDIQTLTNEHIDKFMQLRGVTYRSLCDADDKDALFIGMIADEAEEVGLTELVTYGEDGEVEGFQYERVVALLLEIVKRQEKRISDLEQTNISP